MQLAALRGRLACVQLRDALRNARAFTGSHMYPPDPELIEKEKQKNLRGETKGPIPGLEGWNQTLASVSEAVVKAEREAPDDIDELQRISVEHHAETHADERGVHADELKGTAS